MEASNHQEPSPKLVSNSKIRIEVGPSPGVTQSSTLPRSSHSLQKSHSFSADLSPGAQYRNSTNKQLQPRLDTGGIISQADLQKAKLHLKSSRSFPELLEDGDNSSSGVSSDQDQDSVKEAFLETNIYLLIITFIVSIVHSIFEFLAFKNGTHYYY